ncbi:MAG: hypothetical protein D6691_00595 [Candidatus Hydrogenedentota bacterium]|nr:MAG: hypothetical protein D6691_00595 [Candidatus Hydrogenedentota bacterium]
MWERPQAKGEASREEREEREDAKAFAPTATPVGGNSLVIMATATGKSLRPQLPTIAGARGFPRALFQRGPTDATAQARIGAEPILPSC